MNSELWKSAKLQDPALRDPQSPLRTAIERLIAPDMVVYNEMEALFWRKLAQR